MSSVTVRIRASMPSLASISTARLNRWLEGTVAQHPPPAVAGRRLKIKYITQVKTRPPGFVLSCTRPTSGGGTETFRPDSIFARLSLSGFDSTYMTYDEAARQEAAELESLQAGVEGALGLFAGASVTRTPVVLIPIGEVH